MRPADAKNTAKSYHFSRRQRSPTTPRLSQSPVRYLPPCERPKGRGLTRSANPAVHEDCATGKKRRLAGVLVDQAGDAGDGFFDVFFGGGAELFVALFDHAAGGAGGPVVGDAQQGLGDGWALAGEVVD